MHKMFALLKGFRIYNLVCVSSYDRRLLSNGDCRSNLESKIGMKEDKNYYYIDSDRSGDGDMLSYEDGWSGTNDKYFALGGHDA